VYRQPVAPASSSDSADVETHRQVLVEVADVIRDNCADSDVDQAVTDAIMG
jgi:hypothetical protein